LAGRADGAVADQHLDAELVGVCGKVVDGDRVAERDALHDLAARRVRRDLEALRAGGLAARAVADRHQRDMRRRIAAGDESEHDEREPSDHQAHDTLAAMPAGEEPHSAAIDLPASFGKYYLTEKLATGGMAEIYL